MKKKKITIDTKFDFNLNKKYNKAYQKFTNELFNNFNNYHNINISPKKIIFNNMEYNIIKKIDSKNSVFYILKKSNKKYFLKKSKNVWNINKSMLDVYYKKNNNYFENLLIKAIDDAFNEKNNCLKYYELAKIFNNNFIKIIYINQGFFKDDNIADIKYNFNNSINSGIYPNLISPPSTIIFMNYLDNSKNLRNIININEFELFKVYLVLFYIFSFANLNGYYHNDFKTDNIMVKQQKNNIILDQIKNIKIELDNNYNPIIIDYSNSKKVESSFPFDIYLLSLMMIGNPILSEATLHEPIYFKENTVYFNIIKQIVFILEKNYSNIRKKVSSDRLNSELYYKKLDNNSDLFYKTLVEIFTFININSNIKVDGLM
jgi:hypothetical protein